MPFIDMLKEEGFQSIEQNHEGACGFSFKAHDPVLHRNVFIKYYETCSEANEGILAEPRKVAALFSEVRNAALHIAAVYSAALKEKDGEKYIQIVTEYCEGESLYKYLQKQNMFVYDALEFGKQIIDGLHVLHQKDFVHRDLKPSNLVISNGAIKIIDLGGATEIPQGATYLNTRSKHSIFYRPPEAFDPNNMYGKFSDIYQVGLIVYEMLNGPIIENVENYIVPKIKAKFEKECSCQYDEMDSYYKTEVQDQSIKHLIDKGKLQDKSVNCSIWYVKKLQDIIKKLTSIDYTKRAQSCSSARIVLSSYKGPNWRIADKSRLEINDLDGYNYSFQEIQKKGSSLIEAKRIKINSDKYRSITSINNWNDVYKAFFKEFD